MNHPLIRALAQLVEKAGWTAAQVFLGVIITAGALDATAAQAAAIAAFAAVFTLLANGLPQPVGELSFGVDLLYRTTRTFGSGFFALIAAIPLTDLSIDGVKAAAVAAIPAALTILKGAIASKVGAPTPATLPATLDTVDTTTPGFLAAVNTSTKP